MAHDSKWLLSTSEAESPVFLTGSRVCVFQTEELNQQVVSSSEQLQSYQAEIIELRRGDIPLLLLFFTPILAWSALYKQVARSSSDKRGGGGVEYGERDPDCTQGAVVEVLLQPWDIQGVQGLTAPGE